MARKRRGFTTEFKAARGEAHGDNRYAGKSGAIAGPAFRAVSSPSGGGRGSNGPRDAGR